MRTSMEEKTKRYNL